MLFMDRFWFENLSYESEYKFISYFLSVFVLLFLVATLNAQMYLQFLPQAVKHPVYVVNKSPRTWTEYKLTINMPSTRI